MKELLLKVKMKLILVMYNKTVGVVCASGFFVPRQSAACLNICAFSCCVNLSRQHSALICNCSITTLNLGETADTFMLLITAFICC